MKQEIDKPMFSTPPSSLFYTKTKNNTPRIFHTKPFLRGSSEDRHPYPIPQPSSWASLLTYFSRFRPSAPPPEGSWVN